MLSSLLKLFRQPSNLDQAVADHPASETLKNAVAVLLVRMAKVDGLYSTDEVRVLFGTLKQQLNLSDQDVIDLIKTAENSTQFADSSRMFAAALKAQLNTAEREKIVEMIAEVCRADGKVDEFERMYLESIRLDLGLN